MIERYITAGHRNFCISSSGNAALAAAMFISEYNVKHPDTQLGLRIFVSNKIPKAKLKPLQQITEQTPAITLSQMENPKQHAFELEKQQICKNLRQSIDDTALIGYEALATELAAIGKIGAIFIPTSSGTTAQGLYIGFKKLGLNPQIHIIQTPKCHPLVDNSPAGPSMANAIVDMVGFRKQAVQESIKSSNGKGWVAADEEILLAQNLLKQHENMEVSANGALALAGLQLARRQGWQFTGPVVCLITGK